MQLGAIFATDTHGGMGYENHMPWPPIRSDFQRFRKITTGHVIIMGSRTWCSEDMPNPLPNRHSVVWTNQKSLPRADQNVLLVSGDPADCWQRIQQAFDCQKAWVIGGEQTLRNWMPLCHSVYWTCVSGIWTSDVVYKPQEWQGLFEQVDCQTVTENMLQLQYSYWQRL